MAPENNPYLAPQPVERSVPVVAHDDENPVALFVPATRWRILTLIAIWANLLLVAARLWFDFQLLRLYQSVESLESIDADQEWDLIQWINGLGATLLLVRFLTAGLLITWMYRTHVNLSALGHARLDSKPIWVIVSWFVPFMNLICPYQVMREIWQRSKPQIDDSSEQDSGVLVAFWWAAWIAVIVLGFTSTYLARRCEVASDYVLSLWTDVAYTIATMIAGVLLMLVIVSIDMHQWRRYESRSLERAE